MGDSAPTLSGHRGLRMFVDGLWIKVPNDRAQYRAL